MKKKTYRRELIEWMVLVAVGLALYVTGLHTQVIGQIQRVVLATGLISPDQLDATVAADYNFQLKDASGKVVDFSQFKGEVIFLNFWATWCPPCIAEMPDINDLYSKVGDRVRFVMVSVDQDPNKATEFVARKGFDLPIYFGASETPKVFQSRSIPTTFIISPEGKIVVKQMGMAQYDSEEFKEFILGLLPKEE
ncbi:MAG: thiol-disulfide isomerase/thioredoxin [Marinoscillum sp.]|jgi:thiol-disulfide isomerase/thioredoxin